MLRTIAFELRLVNQDCKTLLDTMRAYSNAFSISAKWGSENQSCNKVDNHNVTYKLTRQSGKERRFVTDTNHCISKQIVNSEYTVFVLEDLSKIRVQKRRGREFDHKLNNWSFYQLEQFIGYKAEALGKHVLLADARYASQKCSNCGHNYKGNREGFAFRCRKCGFELHADLNASRNIAQAGISCLSRLSCQPAKCDTTLS